MTILVPSVEKLSISSIRLKIQISICGKMLIHQLRCHVDSKVWKGNSKCHSSKESAVTVAHRIAQSYPSLVSTIYQVWPVVRRVETRALRTESPTTQSTRQKCPWSCAIAMRITRQRRSSSRPIKHIGLRASQRWTWVKALAPPNLNSQIEAQCQIGLISTFQ